MGKYINSFITLQEFENLQFLKLPYTGFVRGVGYTYPEYYLVELTNSNPASNFAYGNYFCQPAFVQIVDSSPEAIIRSLQITSDKLSCLLYQIKGQEVFINMGNGYIVIVPENSKINYNVEIVDNNDTALKIQCSLNVELENGDRINEYTECSLQDMPMVFGINPSIFYPFKEEKKQFIEDESIGQPGTWESLIPIWGSGRASIDHFQNENYGRAILYAGLAISDVFLIKAIGTGIARGAWKLGSHSWGATRRWLLKKGYVNKGEPVHHWLVKQSTAKKHNIEWITNQPWNLLNMKTAERHMRFGHRYWHKTKPPGNTFEQIWYGTPMWPKATSGSYGGRSILEVVDDNN